MHPMVRITVHLMDDPADVPLSETEHDLVARYDIDGELIEAYAVVGGVKVPVEVDPKVLDRWYAKENAEALAI